MGNHFQTVLPIAIAVKVEHCRSGRADPIEEVLNGKR